VASRVAEERGERSPGIDSVGYVVRGESAICNRTRILFCTTGVLLRQLQNEAALDCISHIVVDEVHERGLDSDILLGLLKGFLPQYPKLHIVLMSATLDVDRFTNYFDGETPHIHIPGRTFPVTDFTLEDVLSITGYAPTKNKKNNKTRRYEPDVNEKAFRNNDDNEIIDDDPTTAEAKKRKEPIDDIVKRIDENSIDYILLSTLVKHLIDNTISTDDGSILVFLPGVQEINNAIKWIQQHTKGMLLTLLPLHGGLQPKEQSRVFPRAAKGYTKVILSTNVAETSVTIPDCTIVIDWYVLTACTFPPLKMFQSKW
jgi:ATP-dependent RNA helicase DHX57